MTRSMSVSIFAYLLKEQVALNEDSRREVFVSCFENFRLDDLTTTTRKTIKTFCCESQQKDLFYFRKALDYKYQFFYQITCHLISEAVFEWHVLFTKRLSFAGIITIGTHLSSPWLKIKIPWHVKSMTAVRKTNLSRRQMSFLFVWLKETSWRFESVGIAPRVEYICVPP